ncbi:MAG: hypothetical protein ACHQAY_24905, partial [Hyphomicrobiales bacterium]
PSRSGLSRRPFQGDRLAAHRFRGRGGLIGVGDESGEEPVPVPVEGGDAAPSSQPSGEFGYGRPQPPSPPVGPQIITLPDPPAGKGVPPRRSAFRAAPAPLWRAGRAPYWSSPEPRHFAHRYHSGASYGGIEPSYGRSYEPGYRSSYGRGYGSRYGRGYEPGYSYAPSYEPSFTYAPSPIALAPCEDAPTGPIYNTPCGVRPYQ